MRPSEAVNLTDRMVFKCPLIRTGVQWVTHWLATEGGDDWTVPFTLDDVHELFSGTREQWSQMIYHQHSGEDRPCVLTRFLEPDSEKNNAPGKGRIWFVIADFVVRELTGGEHDRRGSVYLEFYRAAKIAIYRNLATVFPGVSLSNIDLRLGAGESEHHAFVDYQGGSYSASLPCHDIKATERKLVRERTDKDVIEFGWQRVYLETLTSHYSVLVPMKKLKKLPDDGVLGEILGTLFSEKIREDILNASK